MSISDLAFTTAFDFCGFSQYVQDKSGIGPEMATKSPYLYFKIHDINCKPKCDG
jgi:hypothetical protein